MMTIPMPLFKKPIPWNEIHQILTPVYFFISFVLFWFGIYLIGLTTLIQLFQIYIYLLIVNMPVLILILGYTNGGENSQYGLVDYLKCIAILEALILLISWSNV